MGRLLLIGYLQRGMALGKNRPDPRIIFAPEGGRDRPRSL